MKRKLFQRVTVMMAMFAVLFTSIGSTVSAEQAQLASLNSEKENVKDLTEQVIESTIDISEEEEKALLAEAKNLIKSGQIENKSNNDKVFNNPDVRGIEYEDGIVQYNVSFTYVDEENMDRVSMLNIIFNEDQKSVFKTYEVDMFKNNSDEGVVKSWVDGKQDTNETYDISHLPTTEGDEEESMITTQSWTGCMSDCLGNKNISLWAITGLGILCGASCTAGVPATAGTACYACVNTAGIIGVNAVLDCLERC